LARRDDDRARYDRVQAVAGEMIEVALGLAGKRRLGRADFAALIRDARAVLGLCGEAGAAQATGKSLKTIPGGLARP
jgi:hypothetical protein